ncbi:hypothetical protein CHLRE_02g086456v5 [Chlamydomonas reinhardtii]|nr:uncharacterized protein CHLRE_02g086456v5 [Chlamydomonas reinhardtii]PNW86439.1 hypothetical protein CHLRE_02g086456v5 [Chlamydomonas reinhardtii]
MVPPLKQAWFQPSSTLSAYAKVVEGLHKSLQNWRSESASLLAAPIIFVLGRDVNSATNIRHALVEMLLGHKRPVSLQTGGGSGGGGGGGSGGGGSGSGGGACAHLGSGGGGKGHVEAESAAPPKKWRKRAG